MTRPRSLPLDPSRYGVSSAFGPRKLHGRRTHHDGVDLPTPVGVPLVAVGTGRVSAVGGSLWHKWGYYLHLDLGDGDSFEYHVARDKFPHKVGDVVKRGELLGYTGSSGAAFLIRYKPHTHLGARNRNGYYNPLTLGYSPAALTATPSTTNLEEDETLPGYYIRTSPQATVYFVSYATGRKRSTSSAEFTAVRSANPDLIVGTVSAKTLAGIPGL